VDLTKDESRSRVKRFDIDVPGEGRGAEGGPKEFAMRLKHSREKEKGLVKSDKKTLLNDGRYFTPAQQDDMDCARQSNQWSGHSL
jgi:hypothetical protein